MASILAQARKAKSYDKKFAGAKPQFPKGTPRAYSKAATGSFRKFSDSTRAHNAGNRAVKMARAGKAGSGSGASQGGSM
jgi:hypothetical protein